MFYILVPCKWASTFGEPFSCAFCYFKGQKQKNQIQLIMYELRQEKKSKSNNMFLIELLKYPCGFDMQSSHVTGFAVKCNLDQWQCWFKKSYLNFILLLQEIHSLKLYCFHSILINSNHEMQSTKISYKSLMHCLVRL